MLLQCVLRLLLWSSLPVSVDKHATDLKTSAGRGVVQNHSEKVQLMYMH